MFKKFFLLLSLSFCANSASATLILDAGGPYELTSGSDLVLNGSVVECTINSVTGDGCVNIVSNSFSWGVVPQFVIVPPPPTCTFLCFPVQVPVPTDINTTLAFGGLAIPELIIPWADLCPVGDCVGSTANVNFGVTANFQSTLPSFPPIIGFDPDTGFPIFGPTPDPITFTIPLPRSVVTQLTVVANAVPEPSIITLFGLGLLGLGFARRRKRG